MNKEAKQQIIFSASFLSKLFFLVLGLACFGQLASKGLLTAVTSGLQAAFYSPLPF